jgi:hypothetical protein
MARDDAGNQALIREAIPGEIKLSVRLQRVVVGSETATGLAISVDIRQASVGHGLRSRVRSITAPSQC